MGFFSKLKEGLTKTRDNIVSGIDSVFSGFSSIDDDFYDELEETLIMGDIGVVATEEILDDLKNKVKENKIKNPADCKQLLIDSIKEKMNLDVEVAKLRLMKADHESKRFRLEDQLVRFYPEQLRQQEDYIAGFKADMQTLSDHPVPQEDFVGIELLGKAYADKSAAGETLLALCKTAPHDHDTAIGHYRGLSVTLSYDSFNAQFQLLLRGEMTHIVNLGADARGNLLRIENALNNIPVRMQKAQEQVDSLHQQIEAAKLEITQPFPQELELTTKSARLAELDALLSMDKSAPMNSKSEKPSVLASLERGSSGMQKDTPQRRSDRPLDAAL